MMPPRSQAAIFRIADLCLYKFVETQELSLQVFRVRRKDLMPGLSSRRAAEITSRYMDGPLAIKALT